MSKEAYIVAGVRTPIGNFGGTLSPVRADDLSAHALKALLEKVPNLDPAAIEDVILMLTFERVAIVAAAVASAGVVELLPRSVVTDRFCGVVSANVVAVVVVVKVVGFEFVDAFEAYAELAILFVVALAFTKGELPFVSA
jgi:acetyl-CoA acetyltransferase